MALSILHRATGVALSIGLFVMTWWLMAAAMGPEAYQDFRDIASSPLGLIVLAGWSFALFFHTCSGIRHIVMDMGKLFTIPEIYKGGYTVIIAAVVLTLAFWIAVVGA